MSWPRQGSQKTLEIPKFEFKPWISWVWGYACQGRVGGCPPPKRFTTTILRRVGRVFLDLPMMAVFSVPSLSMTMSILHVGLVLRIELP